jgi:hypothetical protein
MCDSHAWVLDMFSNVYHAIWNNVHVGHFAQKCFNWVGQLHLTMKSNFENVFKSAN